MARESGGGGVSWSGSQGSADMAAADGGLDDGADDGSGMDLTTHVPVWVGSAPPPGDEGGAGGHIGGRPLSQQGRRRQARKRNIAKRQAASRPPLLSCHAPPQSAAEPGSLGLPASW